MQPSAAVVDHLASSDIQSVSLVERLFDHNPKGFG
jgi:hypothetical protein